MKEYFPIGTVVKLKNYPREMMVTGIIQSDPNDPQHREYDYVGVLYPEGKISNKYQLTFDNEDVSEVVFRGFENIERENFLKALEIALNKREESKNE